MNGSNFIWDTTIAIDYLQQNFSQSAENVVELILDQNRPVISVITEIELLCWKSANEADVKAIIELINIATVIELENDVKLKTIELRKIHKIKLPDAVIAVSAIVHNLTLITRNIKDFINISDLKILNPWEI